MNKTRHIKLLLILTTLFLVVNVYGQNLYGRLKIKTLNQDLYWNKIKIIGKDTTIETCLNNYCNQKLIYFIPEGQYTIQIHSVFFDIIEQKVKLNKRSTLKFNLDKYYQIDTSSILFFDRMTNNDTLRIYYDQSGCFSCLVGYYYILRQGQSFYLNYKTESSLKTILLTEKAVSFLKDLERNHKINSKHSYSSTTSTWYSFELNKCILRYHLSGPNYFHQFIPESK